MSQEGKDRDRNELPEPWSAQRKMEVVLRLLRGEDLGEVSREVQLPAPERVVRPLDAYVQLVEALT